MTANPNAMKVTAGLQCVNGFMNDVLPPASITVSQSAVGRGGSAQSIGTSEEVVDFGDITTNGYAFIRNLDPANYVVYGPESGGAMVVFGKLKAGEFALLRISPTIVMRAKADTAACLLDVRIYQD
jgi:hypothetical protein